MTTATRATHSPFRTFTRAEWARLRGATPLSLGEEDLAQLRGVDEGLSIAEVEEIYLPLSRLLELHVAGVRELRHVTSQFFATPPAPVPYVIAVAGSVAAGKSTTARLLARLLERWPDGPRVALVTTDGFLYPNRVLEERGLMHRKGFPESYDRARLLRFVSDLKSGEGPLRVPTYSHLAYDVLEHELVIDRCDIVLLEGLNVLQTGTAHSVMVSDFIDFAIYVDAPEALLSRWFYERFAKLRATAFRDPSSYFHALATAPDAQAEARARFAWEQINLVNLRENVAPTREKATLILEKGEAHAVERVLLRRI